MPFLAIILQLKELIERSSKIVERKETKLEIFPLQLMTKGFIDNIIFIKQIGNAAS